MNSGMLQQMISTQRILNTNCVIVYCEIIGSFGNLLSNMVFITLVTKAESFLYLTTKMYIKIHCIIFTFTFHIQIFSF